MATQTVDLPPVPVALMCAGDVIRYGGEVYRVSCYIPFAVLDGGVLLGNAAAPGGGWCPEMVALPFPNRGASVELVPGGAR